MSKTIGIFETTSDGYIGAISTLNCRLSGVKFVAVDDKRGEDSPDFRITVEGVDLGAGWKATAKSGNPFVRVVLDDPSFPATLNASLVENREGKFSLLWSRQR
ncbi:MAG: DUF736 domain-containing protein [Alphaproteobacteria bacterium]|nr:DUF736 domain-containing protein [Alphaproteobacteria bacterium]